MMIQRRLFLLTEGIRMALVRRIAIGLAIGGCYIAQGLLTALLVADMFKTTIAWDQAVWLLAGIACMLAVRTYLVWRQEISAKKTAGIIKGALRQRLFGRLLELGPYHLQDERTGHIQSTLVDGVEGLEAYLTSYLPQIAITVFSSAVLLGIMATLSWPVALVLLAAILAALFGPRLWDCLLSSRGFNHWASYAKFQSQLLDSLQGMITLKAFNAGVRRGEELKRESQSLYRKTMKQLSISLMDSGIVGLATALGSAIAVGIGVFQVASGSLEIGSLLMILFLSAECFRPVGDLNKHWHAGFLGVSAAPGILELLDSRPYVRDEGTKKLAVAGNVVSVEVDHVTFAYSETSAPAALDVSFKIEPGETVALVGYSGSGKSTIVQLLDSVRFAYEPGASGRPALSDVSFRVDSGRKLALVGPSGAGKSTCLQLLMRFWDVTEGAVRIGGVDIRKLKLEELRELISIVPQDVYLFHASIRENIRLGKPEATDMEVEAAAAAACCHEFIEQLPDGYETNAGERAVQLSGGQRQRIALARAFLKDAPILLMDEATSNLDADNEHSVQQALARVAKGKTVIMIAHRLSTLRLMDEVLVLKDGKVADRGAKESLLQKEGFYLSMTQADAKT
ncbi:ATP-binding cassette domain-containing protein [Paenibacillus oralis]|uniref:ATP-binding cassette domain-containing protein n=1 Tax=Paenibacillus oralis TaxID=2490856 RepID=A0A3P3UC42_9BACL|nr:ABC transporter ATP-binding protein [Paenibacillus oralis]RRJ67198.1 ATP-binding cassette domain-containing protein [Paenibacillus oralis]